MALLNTLYRGTKKVSFFGPKISEILSAIFQKMENIEAFRNSIKSWKPDRGTSRHREVFVQNIGFL